MVLLYWFTTQQGRGHGALRLRFQPEPEPGIKDYYIFVNDAEERNEESLHIKVRYFIDGDVQPQQTW